MFFSCLPISIPVPPYLYSRASLSLFPCLPISIPVPFGVLSLGKLRARLSIPQPLARAMALAFKQGGLAADSVGRERDDFGGWVWLWKKRRKIRV